jgi:hypothetical protein
MSANANSRNRSNRAGKSRHSLRVRLRVVLPLARFRLRQIVGDKPVVLTPSGVELRTLSELVKYQSRLARISDGCAWRWFALFLRSGFAGLKRKVRADKGTSRSFDNRGLALLFLVDKKRAGWSPSGIHRALVMLWPRLYSDSSRPPSYPSVRRFFSQVRP